MKNVSLFTPNLGCDPEFFFRSTGEVIGAENIIPKEGLLVGNSKFIIDGVQAELNPHPYTCRALLSNNIRDCFITLKKEMQKHGKTLTVDFSSSVEISKKELDKLSVDAKKFGCAPSNNVYKTTTGIKINSVDPEIYRMRGAGGHIHLGHLDVASLVRALTKDHDKTVAVLDIICGNTSVLLDRDESNIERRKLYGKPGEYRLPAHGLEYRTLSNFWLTSAQLTSFVLGMARLSVQIIADPNYKSLYEELTSRVKVKNICNAISNNDFDLAMENFLAIEDFLMAVTQPVDHHPVNKANIKQFKHFVAVIRAKGLKEWFPTDPLTHWTTTGDCHNLGFHDFLLSTVNAHMLKYPNKPKVTYINF